MRMFEIEKIRKINRDAEKREPEELKETIRKLKSKEIDIKEGD